MIFIYNADSGLINTVKDFFHKAFKPETYECNLCAVSFGNFSMKRKFKSFINEDLEYKSEFLHRDEFEKQYPNVDATFPSVFVKNGDELKLLISSDDLNALKTQQQLIKLTKTRVGDIEA